MPYIITITGPSGAGKSTTAHQLLRYTNEGFKPRLIPKFTTRPSRDDDRKDEVICVPALPPRCDLTYEHCENWYGLEQRTLQETIDAGQSPIVVLNEIDTVKRVRETFGEMVKSLFIFRESPSLAGYRDLAELRGVRDEEEPIRRYMEARKFYSVYYENIHVFNHVILNIGTLDQRDRQAKQIVDGLSRKSRHILYKQREGKQPPRLLVAIAKPLVEKERLRLAIESLGAKLALYIPWERLDGRHSEEDAAYDGSGIIYEDPEYTRGIEPAEIWQGLQRKIFQIVSASNVGTVDHFREIFGELVVLAYIHSEPESEEHPRQQRSTFKAYLDNFDAFDHVLIDSGGEDDIFSQMYHLLQAYSNGKAGLAISEALKKKLEMKIRTIGSEKSALAD